MEIQLEVKEELAEQYRDILEQCMIEAGNYYIQHDQVKITATAIIGNSWAETK